MTPHQRASRFCARFGLGVPILEAPMAGACPPGLAIAVAGAGGMGAAGVLLDPPDAISNWVERFRAGSSGPFQLNIWIPDPPGDDHRRIEAARGFLSRFGPPGTPGPPAPVFAEQCEAILAAQPTAVSSIMGLFDDVFAGRVHRSLVDLPPERTVLTRAYSGRLGRAVPTAFVGAWAGPDGATPAPYPDQRRLVGEWRRGQAPGVDRVNQWAGQSCALARAEPAGEIVSRMWAEAQELIRLR